MEKRLRVGLIGLGDIGCRYVAALLADDQFNLVGVADTNAERLRGPTESGRVVGYEDCRSLIVEQAGLGLDLLFVALEPFQSIGFVELAARRGIGVFHKAPFARNVREGHALVRTFEEAGLPLVVSRLWPFDPALAGMRQSGVAQSAVYTALASVGTTQQPIGWRGDLAQAGGGVLLNGAYEHVDLLVQLLGLPESVYAQCVVGVPPEGRRPYDTEDAVHVSLHFGARRIGAVAAWRGAAVSSSRLVLVAPERTIEITDGPLAPAEPRPDAPNVAPFPGAPSNGALAFAIGAFGAAQRGGERHFESHAREHLATLAVIEAAYLSAKTGGPESPTRFMM